MNTTCFGAKESTYMSNLLKEMPFRERFESFSLFDRSYSLRRQQHEHPESEVSNKIVTDFIETDNVLVDICMKNLNKGKFPESLAHIKEYREVTKQD